MDNFKKSLAAALALYQLMCFVYIVYTYSNLIYVYGVNAMISNILLVIPVITICILPTFLLIRGKIKGSLKATIVNQGLQILQIKINGFGILYYSGIYFALGIYKQVSPKFFVDGEIWGLRVYFYINSPHSESFFLINVFPIIILAIIFAIFLPGVGVVINRDEQKKR